jgi:hypothetical protein
VLSIDGRIISRWPIAGYDKRLLFLDYTKIDITAERLRNCAVILGESE